MSSERRHYPRVPYPSTLRRVAEIQKPQKPSKGVGRDVSLGGMSLTCPNYLTEGQLLILHFILPKNMGSIHCEGRVQWINKEGSKYLVGVKFIDMKPENAYMIQRYIDAPHAHQKDSFMVKFFSMILPKKSAK